jgi:hypothetical protein
MLIFLLAQLVPPFMPVRASATPLPFPLEPRPVAYVSVRGDSRTKTYLPPTWDPRHPTSALPCPKRGDKTWSESISFPVLVIRFDCPVGVAYKTWEPSGRRVHIGVRSTTSLHPGAVGDNGSVTYELTAPQ